VLVATLTADVQHTALDLDLDVVLGQPRQVGTDVELAFPLEYLDVRRPDTLASLPRAREELDPGHQATESEVVEQVVHLVHEPSHEPERASRPPLPPRLRRRPPALAPGNGLLVLRLLRLTTLFRHGWSYFPRQIWVP